MNLKDVVLGWGLIAGMVMYAVLQTIIKAGRCAVDATAPSRPASNNATTQQ